MQKLGNVRPLFIAACVVAFAYRIHRSRFRESFSPTGWTPPLRPPMIFTHARSTETGGCLFRGCNPCCYFCQPHPHRVSCTHQDDGMCQEEHRENELCFSSFSPLDSSSGPSDPKRGRSQNKRFWARPSTSQLYFVVAYFMNCRCGGHAIFRVYLNSLMF